MAMPVSGLRDWLQGFSRHDAGGPYVAVPADTESSLQSPDGWKISYDTWQREDGANSSHPKRIDLSRNTEQAGQVSIRIVIDTWQPTLISCPSVCSIARRRQSSICFCTWSAAVPTVITCCKRCFN